MSIPTTCKQLVLKQRPSKETADFGDELFELKTKVPLAGLVGGQVLLEAKVFSCDPAQRIWITAEKQAIPPVRIGEPMRAVVGGTVVVSKADGFQVGEDVVYFGDWSSHHVRDAAQVNKLPPGTPLAIGMTVGLNGATAYIGLMNRGQLRSGSTVVVSGAAGATGSIAVQIAKLMDCKVIGTAGGAEKCQRVVAEFGADACIDYKSEDVNARLSELCGDSIDLVFDNVGGEFLEAALNNLALHARVILCGAISRYSSMGVAVDASALRGPRNYDMLMMRRASMHGFTATDNPSELAEASQNIGAWLAKGQLKLALDLRHAPFEAAPSIVRNLFTSSNTGKLVHVIT